MAEAKADFLADAQKLIPGVPAKLSGSYFDQGGRRWRAQASYTGRFRSLEADELIFIRNWLKSVGRENMETVFTTSYLFTAGGKDYWLPVEAPVVAFFPKELKPGDTIDIYLAEIGGTQRKDGWIWLPFVEEFRRSDKSAGP